MDKPDTVGQPLAWTPGPWAIRFARNGHPYSITTTAIDDWDRLPGRVGKQILRWGSFMLPSSDEALANARLIAAAPALYEALDDCIDLLRHLGAHDGPDTILHAARQALLQASDNNGGGDV